MVKDLELLLYEERQDTVQPREDEAQGISINVYKYLMEGSKEDRSSQWHSVTGQKALGTI